jgi:hypothetical protein
MLSLLHVLNCSPSSTAARTARTCYISAPAASAAANEVVKAGELNLQSFQGRSEGCWGFVALGCKHTSAANIQRASALQLRSQRHRRYNACLQGVQAYWGTVMTAQRSPDAPAMLMLPPVLAAVVARPTRPLNHASILDQKGASSFSFELKVQTPRYVEQ